MDLIGPKRPRLYRQQENYTEFLRQLKIGLAEVAAVLARVLNVLGCVPQGRVEPPGLQGHGTWMR